jgi:REP element-mobilizing transposase RayT
MAQSLVQIYVHIVFSTKNRQPFLEDRAFRDRTHGYLKGVCDNQGSPSLRIGGVEDHVHILCRLSKTLDVSTLVRELKRDSSKWVKEQEPRLADFYWQNGYGAFSISPAHVDPLKQYIVNRSEQRKRRSISLFAPSSSCTHSKLAPGRINLDTPSVNFSSLKLMGKQRMHGSSCAKGGNKVEGENRATKKAISLLSPFSPVPSIPSSSHSRFERRVNSESGVIDKERGRQVDKEKKRWDPPVSPSPPLLVSPSSSSCHR